LVSRYGIVKKQPLSMTSTRLALLLIALGFPFAITHCSSSDSEPSVGSVGGNGGTTTGIDVVLPPGGGGGAEPDPGGLYNPRCGRSWRRRQCRWWQWRQRQRQFYGQRLDRGNGGQRVRRRRPGRRPAVAERRGVPRHRWR